MTSLQIKSVHFTAKEKLNKFIDEMITKLDQFDGWFNKTDVTLALNKESNRHENKVVELKVKGKIGHLFTKVQSHSFEKGVKLATDKIIAQALHIKRW